MIQTLSLCAEITMDLHNLNSEGTEGNQQQTRMVHVVDKDGKRKNVNAVSGDMFKHILVEHLTPILLAAGQPLSSGARVYSPDRITVDPEFKAALKKLAKPPAADILKEMLKRCAVTDIAGTLLTEKGNSIPRKSCVEFGWVVGIPEKTHTEQYFHVKYDADRGKSAGQDPRGEGTVAGRQAIFHRPASSGVYALICHLELSRVGVNDITHELTIEEGDRRVRQRALVQALLATLVKPSGAQRNTQNPHVVDCRGVISTSTSYLPAPTVSPLNTDYEQQMKAIVETLNKLSPNSVTFNTFDTLAGGVALIEEIASHI